MEGAEAYVTAEEEAEEEEESGATNLLLWLSATIAEAPNPTRLLIIDSSCLHCKPGAGAGDPALGWWKWSNDDDAAAAKPRVPKGASFQALCSLPNTSYAAAIDGMSSVGAHAWAAAAAAAASSSSPTCSGTKDVAEEEEEEEAEEEE
jgi:hypothetical protein